MNLFILSIFSLLFASQVSFAGPAVEYTCVGYNKITKESVSYDLVFSDSVPEYGYTYQAIEITKEGGFAPKAQKHLLLNGDKKRPCKKDEDGNVSFPFGFDMTPGPQGKVPYYEVSFKGDCGKEMNYDVESFCFFTY
jgi:hypothetical protein